MAKRQITDEEDRLKRQARRRLIGAVALTTAIVVVLPMIMDSQPRQVGKNIELRIPDKDAAGEFSSKINLPPVVSAPVTEVPASEPVAAASQPVAVPPAPAPVVPAPAPAVVAPAPVPAAPEPKPAPAVEQPAAKPEPKAEPAKQEAKPQQPKHEVKTAPAKHAKAVALTEQGDPAPQSGFIVQIGAFNNADTAHSWQKNLKSQGFKAYTEKLGSKTRVRIGPYSSREAANAARKKLEKTQGLHSNIIDLN